MTGQFTQQSLMQGAYANSIGMANPGFASEQLAGSAISGVAGIGAPVATAGLAMLGADPMSLGMRAGMAALPSMGIGGAIGMGAAVAAPVAAGMYAASVVGDQMMTGMQQQQDLGMSMRQNYSQFQNGGRGFNNSQIQNLGSQIRGMTHEVGAGGEMASFKELSGLASNMGNMGFVQTTRDVQQFGQKFRQMVDTMKTIAKDLGTNLEAAAEMATGMRGSGLFQSADQIRMAQQMRGNAVTGNISTMETGQMASIGSQIARSVGGYGKQGAFAGAKTIGQIGRALESGTLTEDDIYNATGQTGAAGRTAMATSMMQSSARFMKSNKGRIMLASMAGENGTLDEDAVQDLMTGSAGIGNTMQNVGKNMKKVGAANFMRNEGRLRSAVLEKFGGNIGTMQLMQWTNSMGIDIESMGDREMILAKRMTGMGNDELEVAVKMAKNLRRDAASGDDRRRQDEHLQKMRQKRSGQGVQGIRNSFNQFREKVQGGLQQSGAELYNEASSWIERQINEMTGMYAEALTDDTRKQFKQLTKLGLGTASGKASFQKLFGGGAATGKDIEGLGDVDLLAGSGNKPEHMRFSRSGQQGGILGLLRGGLGGESTLEKAGYDPMTTFTSRGEGYDEKMFQQRKSDTLAMITGSKAIADTDILKAAATMEKGVLARSDIMEELGAAGGDQYTKAMAGVIAKEGTPEVKSMLASLDKTIASSKSGPERTKAIKRKAQLMQSVGLRGGLKGKALRSGSAENVFDSGSLGTFSDERSRQMAYGKALFAGVGEEERDEDNSLLGKVGKGAAYGAAIGTVVPVIGNIVGAGVGAAVGALDFLNESDEEKQRWLKPGGTLAGGAFLRSDRGREMMSMGFKEKGDTVSFRDAKRKFDDMAPTMKGSKDKMKIAEYETMRGAIAARQMREGEKGKESETRAAAAKKYFGGDEDKMMKAVRGLASASRTEDEAQNRELASETASIAEAELGDMRKTGMYKEGGLASTALSIARGEDVAGLDSDSMDVLKGLHTAKGKQKYGGAIKLIKASAERMRGLERMSGATAENFREVAKDYSNSQDAFRNTISSMSTAELTGIERSAKEGVAGFGGDQLRLARGEKSRRRRAALNVGQKGANIAAAGFLGFEGMSRTDQLNLRNAKGPEGMIAELEAMGGEFDKSAKDDIGMLLKELKTGKSDRDFLGSGSAAGVKANAMEKLREVGEKSGVGAKMRDRRLDQDKAENPVQAQMLAALNRMADNMDASTRNEGEKSKDPQKVNITQDGPIEVVIAK